MTKDVRQVAPICQTILIITVTTIEPVMAAALPSAEISLRMCSTSVPAPRHMSEFVGNSIKSLVSIEWRYFPLDNVDSTVYRNVIMTLLHLFKLYPQSYKFR